MADELKILSQFICSFSLDQMTPDVIQRTRGCVLDTLGAALGASGSCEVRKIAECYSNWTGLGTNGSSAALWGLGCRANLLSALMINGLLSHELELDDVHTQSKSHIGAVVIPSAWTIADAISSSGKELLEAVIVGYEVMGRVGMGMDVASNRKRGWHTTGIVGPFGAAAAAAKLLNLDERQTLSALGMAGTQSAGLWAFLEEGSTCKKLHPARAAVNGVSACLLSRCGMTGPAHILDAKDGGLYRAVSDNYDLSRLTEGLGQSFEIMKIDKKPYPCCRTTHHAIDAALELRNGLRPEEIAFVLVETYDIGVLQCGFSKYPESSVEAKFSIPYTCAAAFVFGKLTLSEFSDEALHNQEVKRIANATTVVADPFFTQRYPKRWGSRMTVTLRNGTEKTCQIDDMSGSVSAPLSPEQEEKKFLGLVEPLLGSNKAAALCGKIGNIETLNVLPDIS